MPSPISDIDEPFLLPGPVPVRVKTIGTLHMD
jgi:hypothetical protein